jgi:hypothetical protein
MSKKLKAAAVSFLNAWQHLAGGAKRPAPPDPPLAPAQPHPAGPALAGCP